MLLAVVFSNEMYNIIHPSIQYSRNIFRPYINPAI